MRYVPFKMIDIFIPYPHNFFYFIRSYTYLYLMEFLLFVTILFLYMGSYMRMCEENNISQNCMKEK